MIFTAQTESYWGMERGIEKTLNIHVRNRVVLTDMGSVVITHQFITNKYTTRCYWSYLSYVFVYSCLVKAEMLKILNSSWGNLGSVFSSAHQVQFCCWHIV